MKFEYTALTKNNKKIIGALDAEGKEAAHEELHKMGLAIIDVKEISDEEYQQIQEKQESIKAEKGIKTFSFNAIDGNGKEVDGTIDAIDDFSAFKRLKTEYSLKINKLFPTSATDEEKEKAASMLETFEKKLKESAGQSDKGGSQKEKELEEKNAAIEKSFISEIDNIISHTKKILETSKNLFSNATVQEIQNTLGELEKIKSSNNIKHIKELSDKLYDLISNPDSDEGKADEEYQTIINDLEENTASGADDAIYKKAVSIAGIKSIFKNITTRFKKLNQPQLGKPKESIINRIKTKINDIFTKFKKKEPETPAIPADRQTDTATAEGDVAVGDAHVRPEDEDRDTKPTDTPSDQTNVQPEKFIEQESETEDHEPKKMSYITYILSEIDSFISWLLCFYIIYFFLVNFALEKNIGLNSEFVIKTFKTPLILNITILLLIFHFALRVKSIYLRGNILASLFLLFLSIGSYIILIVNF